MYQLVAISGKAKNSIGEELNVDYHLLAGNITIGDKIVVSSESIELNEITKKEMVMDDMSFVYAEYGTIVGIVASIGAIFLGNYNEAADFIIGFALNITIYGVIGLVFGSFIRREVPFYTFTIRLLKDNTIWTIRCRKEMLDVLQKFSVNYNSESTTTNGVSNRFKSLIQEKVSQVKNSVSESESTDSISKLEKYHDLYQRGVISEEEFKDLKMRILRKEVE